MTCFETGGFSIFETASPTFKLRFTYMTGASTEEEVDRIAQRLRAFRWPGDRRIAAIVNIAYEAWVMAAHPESGQWATRCPPARLTPTPDHGVTTAVIMASTGSCASWPARRFAAA
jgi:hypothetical protein